MIRILSILLLLGACAHSSADPSQTLPVSGESLDSTEAVPVLASDADLQEQSYHFVWRRIGESYPYADMRGIDWSGAYFELLPAAEAAESAEELRPVLASLLATLGESHFVVHPGTSYEALHQDEAAPSGDQSGRLDLDIRLVDGECLVVRLDSELLAGDEDLEVGDALLQIDDRDISELLSELKESEVHEEMLPFVLRRTVLAALRGAPESSVQMRWRDSSGEERQGELTRTPRTGSLVKMGNLPSIEVVYQDRVMETESGRRVGYIYFNIFLGDVVQRFAKSMERFVEEGVDGVIVDLRGNPGGLGAMSRGMAGHFIFDAEESLGMMKTRQAELSFYVVPKAPAQRFDGPLALLVDEQSASTSEILVGGLQDLGRGSVVGSRSAGMALPSVIERMPNGDAVQFVMGDLVTSSGYRIEGNGVKPDTEVHLTAASLAGGKDPVVEAALNWIGESLVIPSESVP